MLASLYFSFDGSEPLTTCEASAYEYEVTVQDLWTEKAVVCQDLLAEPDAMLDCFQRRRFSCLSHLSGSCRTLKSESPQSACCLAFSTKGKGSRRFVRLVPSIVVVVTKLGEVAKCDCLFKLLLSRFFQRFRLSFITLLAAMGRHGIVLPEVEFSSEDVLHSGERVVGRKSRTVLGCVFKR